jgi:hypothetical protein
VKRMVRVLAVAALVAMILVASISPAVAKRAAGGQLLESTEKPCDATANAQNDTHGADPRMDPPSREVPGCWVLLPYSEDRND